MLNTGRLLKQCYSASHFSRLTPWVHEMTVSFLWQQVWEWHHQHMAVQYHIWADPATQAAPPGNVALSICLFWYMICLSTCLSFICLFYLSTAVLCLSIVWSVSHQFDLYVHLGVCVCVCVPVCMITMVSVFAFCPVLMLAHIKTGTSPERKVI